MRVYLVQHGAPVSKEENPDRPLSEQGRNDVSRVADTLERSGVRVRTVFHSGKTRAAQTAALLAEKVSPGSPASARDGLAPLDEVGPVVAFLEAEAGDVMLVGHLPHLGKLAALLTSGRDDAQIVSFRQGGVCCLERQEDDGWSVAWMIVPEWVH